MVADLSNGLRPGGAFPFVLPASSLSLRDVSLHQLFTGGGEPLAEL